MATPSPPLPCFSTSCPPPPKSLFLSLLHVDVCTAHSASWPAILARPIRFFPACCPPGGPCYQTWVPIGCRAALAGRAHTTLHLMRSLPCTNILRFIMRHLPMQMVHNHMPAGWAWLEAWLSRGVLCGGALQRQCWSKGGWSQSVCQLHPQATKGGSACPMKCGPAAGRRQQAEIKSRAAVLGAKRECSGVCPGRDHSRHSCVPRKEETLAGEQVEMPAQVLGQAARPASSKHQLHKHHQRIEDYERHCTAAGAQASGGDWFVGGRQERKAIYACCGV